MQPNAVCLPCPDAAPSSRGSWLARFLGAALTKLVEWQERAEQRAHLGAMDERLRKDIGINYADALREAEKPFWKP